MKKYKLLKIGLKTVKARIFNQKIPLFVSWNITDRCNFRCKYCNIWRKKSIPELETSEILSIIDILRRNGLEAISFIGGEPLIRRDLGEIISYCKSKDIYTKVATNGYLLPERVMDIKDVDLVKISLDGPKHIHDSQRKAGSYERVLESVNVAKKYKIKIGLNCVITRQNIDYIIDEVLPVTRALGVKISFQPLEKRNGFNQYVDSQFPAKDKYKKVLAKLIDRKLKRENCIANSLKGLKYLYQWPIHSDLKCWAGLLHFRITPDGWLMGCDRVDHCDSIKLTQRGDLKNRIAKMEEIHCKDRCWQNSTIELNYLISFSVDALINLRNIICNIR